MYNFSPNCRFLKLPISKPKMRSGRFSESESEISKEEKFPCYAQGMAEDGGWVEASRLGANNNCPLKRPHQAGRLNVCSTNGGSNGAHAQANGNGHHQNQNQKSRPTSGSNHGVIAKGKTNFYRIVIAVVAIFFLVQTLGVFFLLLPRADLRSHSSDFHPHLKYNWPEEVVPREDVRFMPRNVVERLVLSKSRVTVANLRDEIRSPIRPPRLALVCPNLARGAHSLHMLTLAKGLQALGYKLEVFTLKDGELRSVWESLGVAVRQLAIDAQNGATVDWLNYEGVIASSLNAKSVLNSLVQEPFINVPVIWIIFDDALGRRIGVYESSAAKSLILDWRYTFRRADVVVFPDYALPMIYTIMDTGNFFVIPGSPLDVWKAKEYMLTHSRSSLRANHNLGADEFAIAVVGSPFLYDGVWREHALVMRALARVLPLLSSDTSAKTSRGTHLFVMGHGNKLSHYGAALQVMAEHLGLPNGSVHYVGAGEDVTGKLWMCDAVVYASYRDEQAFPSILTRAMSLRRPDAPNRSSFRDHIVDGESGLLFPVGDHIKLSEAIVNALENPKIVAMATVGELNARDLLALNVTMSFGELLESIVEFPSDSDLPRPVIASASKIQQGWYWDALSPANYAHFHQDHMLLSSKLERSKGDEDDDIEGSALVRTLEEPWTMLRSVAAGAPPTSFSVTDWDFLNDADFNDSKTVEGELEMERIEQEELEERKAQSQSSWEDVTRMVRKAEVHKDDLKERSDEELERTGQPLCIYEPYHGQGAWPFLHKENPLYRGLAISTHGMRPGGDDVDAQIRLPGLLNDSYYRNVLCEYGAFFAIASRIDQLHRNAWIGFQPWRSASRNVALTGKAEDAISEAVRTGRDGDALYFWAHIDGQARNLSHRSPTQNSQHFWIDCDSSNYGQCRDAFAGCLRKMYGLPDNWKSVPPMPSDSGTWSALHCWVMPTASFVEFILFARMFVDALDAQHYEEHHNNGRCCFVRFQHEGKHCYCRLLEGLVNVWAYHSARKMFYVDPHTGEMWEQHPLETRKGKMWVKFFNLKSLKGMDEDLAEAADEGDHPRPQWLWPQTGEVFWQGIFERERRARWRLKVERRQKQKEKLFRMRNRTRQKSLGKYVKPPPGLGYLHPLSSSTTVE